MVLAILILLAAMILPTIGPMRRQGRMRVAASTVAESLRLARSLAIAQSAPYSVDWLDDHRLRIYGGFGAFAAASPVVDTTSLPDGVVRQSASATSVSFQPDGSCSGIVVVIHDSNQTSDTRTIDAKVASGRISVSGGSR